MAHLLKIAALPDKIQGLFLVYASGVSPFPVQKIPFIRAAGVGRRMAEVALGTKIKQVSIAVTTCSQSCLFSVALILHVICDYRDLICQSGWKCHVISTDSQPWALLTHGGPFANVGGEECWVVATLGNAAGARWEPGRC